MKYLILFVLSGFLSLNIYAQAEISVRYVEPMKYSDIENTEQSRARSIKDFEVVMNEYFLQAAQKYLKANHRLKLDIIDVDKAGNFRFDLFPAHRGLRVLKDTAVVRIKVKYTLYDEQQTVISSGEEKLREFFNMTSAIRRHNSSEKLYFEKAVLSDWLSNIYQ